MGDVGLGELLTPVVLIAALLAVPFAVARLRAAALARCPTCRARVSPRAARCPACGGPL